MGQVTGSGRTEERRGGEECVSLWSQEQYSEGGEV